MKKMKAFSVVLLIFALLLSAVACGGGTGPEQTASEGNSDGANDANAPEQENTDGDKSNDASVVFDMGGRTIRLAAWWDGTPKADTELGELSVQRHKEVEKKYNVKIQYINVPFNEMVQKVTSTALSGEPFADLIRLEHRWIPGLLAGGYLKPLDDFLQVTREDVLPKTVQLLGTFNGKLYGFNDSANESGGLFYNKTMFKREGLPDPYELQQKGEWTWDAFLDAAKKLTKDTNGDGKPDQFGLGADPTILANYLIHSNDGKVVDAETGEVAFDSPNAIEAYEFMADLYNKHKVIKPNEGNNWEDPRKYFTQGKVGMTQGWVWEGPDRKQNMTDEWGYVFFPKGPKASDYVVPVTNSNMWFIPAGAKDPGKLYEIWKELVLWDKLEEGFNEWLEQSLPDENSIDTAKQMPSKMRMENWEGYNLGEVLYAMNDRIAKGEEPPATAVAKVKSEAQSRINQVLKK